MTFSYSQPVAGVFPTKKDEVRFLIMDTVETQFSLSNEEIDYLLNFFSGSAYLAASQAALTLSVSYAKEATIASKTVGDLSLSLTYMDTSTEYKHLSQHLRLGRIDNTLTVKFEEAPEQFKIGQFDELRP
jgi:hypothetical protein